MVQAAAVRHAHSGGRYRCCAAAAQHHAGHERCPPNFNSAVQAEVWLELAADLGMCVGDLLRLELVVEECSAERLVATVQSG